MPIRKITIAIAITILAITQAVQLAHAFGASAYIEDAWYRLTHTDDVVVFDEPTTQPENTEETDSCSIEEDISETPTHITIPSIRVSLPITPVPFQNGTWDVFPHVANYAEGTSLINATDGNVGIYGHDRADAFNAIKGLQPDDIIYVFTKNYRTKYIVLETNIISPTNVDIFDYTEQPMVTLLTCDGVFSQHRFAVTAKLETIEKKDC